MGKVHKQSVRKGKGAVLKRNKDTKGVTKKKWQPNVDHKNSKNAHTLPKPGVHDKTKFLGFAERCRRMSANPIKVLKVLAKPDDDHETHFSATLHKWKGLNVSSPFFVSILYICLFYMLGS